MADVDNQRIWWWGIREYLDRVNQGYISGEWADPSPKGWTPPLQKDGEILLPHH